MTKMFPGLLFVVAEVRRCKRRRLAWLRSKEVAWWDDKAQQAQDKVD